LLALAMNASYKQRRKTNHKSNIITNFGFVTVSNSDVSHKLWFDKKPVRMVAIVGGLKTNLWCERVYNLGSERFGQL
jgi:hypothetical protein